MLGVRGEEEWQESWLLVVVAAGCAVQSRVPRRPLPIPLQAGVGRAAPVLFPEHSLLSLRPPAPASQSLYFLPELYRLCPGAVLL